MPADRLTRALASYQAGALTGRAICVEVLMAAGEGDPEGVFARLSPDLQSAIKCQVAHPPTSADEFRILESCCTLDPDTYAADLRRREEVAYRGMMALRRVIHGITGSE